MSNGNGHHWSKFCWRDHHNEMALRWCSLAARGFWVELLCIMHEGTPVGHLTINGRPLTPRQIAASAHCTEREAKKLLAELEEAGVFSRTPEGVIFCRRMAREAAAEVASSAAWKAYGTNGGNPQIIRGTVAKVDRQRGYRRSDSPQKTERIFQRDGGRCHWCQIPLERDNPVHPHFFHVDHIIAVRDGGGTEEDNLVASCQRCNMDRARHADPPGNKPNGTVSDNKPPDPSDSNPPVNPTATLGGFRQEPSVFSPQTPLSTEQETEPEEEEREVKDLASVSPVLARVAAACETPPEGTYGDNATQLAVQNLVGKVARNLTSSGEVPMGKRAQRTQIEQINGVLYGEEIDPDGPRRGPVDPQRTVAEQFIALGLPVPAHLVDAVA
jgi:hypothetical protein